MEQVCLMQWQVLTLKKILLVDFHGQTVRNEEYFSRLCVLCVLYNRIKKLISKCVQLHFTHWCLCALPSQ